MDILNHLGRSLSVAYLYDVYEDDVCVDLVLELCEGGQLWRRIKRGRYTEAVAARILREVLRAIAQCHAAGVLVRDVKPENFLFLSEDEEDYTLKMIDFGESCRCGRMSCRRQMDASPPPPPGIATYCNEVGRITDRAGTPMFLSPEVVRQSYGPKADVWAAGMIAYLMLSGKLPFKPGGDEDDGDDDDEERHNNQDLYRSNEKFDNKTLFRQILYAPLDFSSSPWGDGTLSPEAVDLVTRLLDRDENRRPCAEEALQHPWFAKTAGADKTIRALGPPKGKKEVGAFVELPLSDTLVQVRRGESGTALHCPGWE